MSKFIPDGDYNDVSRKEISDELPYTLIGHTSLQRSFNITMTAAGFKKIASQLKNDDSVSVEVSEKEFSVKIIRHKASRKGSR